MKNMRVIRNILISILSLYLILTAVGKWMLFSDPLPESLDVIFTFSGENVRDRYTQELLKKYPHSKVYISSHINRKEYLSRYWIKENDHVNLVGYVDTCTNTKDEIFYLKNLLQDREFTEDCTIGLVSSPYHLRRIKVLINLYINFDEVKFTYLSVPSEYYGKRFGTFSFINWWCEGILRSELLKIVSEFVIWMF